MFFRSKETFPNDVHSVLFICMGNICRSPAGEGVFTKYVEEQGMSEKIFVDSAGTLAAHTGQTADDRMIEAAKRRGYQLESIARKVTRKDIENFDLLVAMDFDNLMNLYHVARAEPEHIRLLGSFLEGAENNDMARSVPDPYYGGPSGFDEVLDMIEQATPAIYEHLISIDK